MSNGDNSRDAGCLVPVTERSPGPSIMLWVLRPVSENVVYKCMEKGAYSTYQAGWSNFSWFLMIWFNASGSKT